LSYFDYVMLTYERYQALRAINIRVPGEPGNEAIGTRQPRINGLVPRLLTGGVTRHRRAPMQLRFWSCSYDPLQRCASVAIAIATL